MTEFVPLAKKELLPKIVQERVINVEELPNNYINNSRIWQWWKKKLRNNNICSKKIK
jgi:hypothetical protein